MRKILAAVFLLSVLFLSGCLGFFKKEAAQKPAADRPSEKASGASAASQPPSFQDGDFYLQALSGRRLDTCAKIGNAKLKLKCQQDVRAVLN